MPIIKPVDIRRAAMDLLAFREHSIQELVTKLTRRFQKKYFGRSRNTRSVRCGEDQCYEDQCHEESLQEIDHLDDLIIDQIDILADEDLQSDQRFAESFVRSRINKGQGPLRIKRELTARGVSSQIVSMSIEGAGTDWTRVIMELSNRKYGDSKVQDDREKAKRIRFFQYRGFNYEHIAMVIN